MRPLLRAILRRLTAPARGANILGAWPRPRTTTHWTRNAPAPEVRGHFRHPTKFLATGAQTHQEPLDIPVRCCDNHDMKITSATIIPTGIAGTSAAHPVIDHRYDESPITIVCSTTEIACSDWVCGDKGHQGPVHQPADKVPAIGYSTIDGFPIWHARTGVRCKACGQRVSPWAFVRDEHLEGD